MKKSLAITLAAAALILVAALAALTVLEALAGQRSGLEQSSAAYCRPRAHGSGQGISARMWVPRPGALSTSR